VSRWGVILKNVLALVASIERTDRSRRIRGGRAGNSPPLLGICPARFEPEATEVTEEGKERRRPLADGNENEEEWLTAENTKRAEARDGQDSSPERSGPKLDTNYRNLHESERNRGNGDEESGVLRSGTDANKGNEGQIG